ncbi:MAG: T9SS type A sorting domain-containing protein [candidate division Zixibacteria bacterium]|nr:T9SS type A sorting domain-containing protein [candidate division Zixibacteria bacterium]
MKKLLKIVSIPIFFSFFIMTAVPGNASANQIEKRGEEINPAPLAIISIAVTVVGIGATIWGVWASQPDPIAETYNYAYAGSWCCGASDSESDEAYFPDLLAETQAGPVTCRHGAYGMGFAKAWFDQVEEGDTRATGHARGNCYASAPSCHAEAEGYAKLQGSTAWKKSVLSGTVDDSMYMKAQLYFDEFSLKALNVPGYTDDDTANIKYQVTWGTDTLTVFEGSVINNGDSLETTGDFIGMDIVRDDSGYVTFGTWPDTIEVDFYAPDSSEITINSIVSPSSFAGGPEVCEICGDVDMFPDAYPIEVPPGGSFGLTGIIANPTQNPIQNDVWVGVMFNGNFFELWNFPNIHLNPGQQVQAHLVQEVPVYAPPGQYEYIAFCGQKPELECDFAIFDFNVAGPPLTNGFDKWGIQGGWNNESSAKNRIIPEEPSLSEAYPNPFNAEVTIPFTLTSAGHVELKVYNLSGQLVETLADSHFDSGNQYVTWDASGLTSGIYFYKLSTDGKTFTKRMTLLK